MKSKTRFHHSEGLAECLYNDGIENFVQVGEVVYVREIPNMQGHCVVVANGKPPIVGYHLDRFRILPQEK
jgi:hypothetical protein